MIVVGDVTGRGAEAAALTAQARHTLRTAGTLLGDPVAAVEQLNRALVQQRDLPICTVAVVLLVDTPADRGARSRAPGHPQPLLVRDGDVRPVGALRADGRRVGGRARGTPRPCRARGRRRPRALHRRRHRRGRRDAGGSARSGSSETRARRAATRPTAVARVRGGAAGVRARRAGRRHRGPRAPSGMAARASGGAAVRARRRLIAPRRCAGHAGHEPQLLELADRADRGGGDRRPRRRRAAEQVALAELDAEGGERGELAGRLDALAADLGLDAAGEDDEELDERRLRASRCRRDSHEAAVELDDVGLHAHDLLEARVARAGVVDGDPGAAAAQLGEAGLERAVLGRELVLGDLDETS